MSGAPETIRPEVVRRELVWEDTAKRGQYERAAPEIRQRFQNLLDAWARLGFAPENEITDANAEQICKEPETHVRKLMYDNSSALKSLPLKKESVLAMIELPAGTAEFTEAAKMVAWAFAHSTVPGSVVAIEGGKAVLSARWEAWLDGQTRRFAQGRQAEALDLVNHIEKLAKELQAGFPDAVWWGKDDTSVFYPSNNGLAVERRNLLNLKA